MNVEVRRNPPIGPKDIAFFEGEGMYLSTFWTVEHPETAACPDLECMQCAVRDCPHGEPLHYHHDGCPSCCSKNTAASVPRLFLAAYVDGEIAGIASAFWDRVEKKTLFVDQLYVVSKRRFGGIGTTLMKAIEEAAAENGTTDVSLVPKDSTLGFYRKMGYFPRMEDEFKDFVSYTNPASKTRREDVPFVGKVCKRPRNLRSVRRGRVYVAKKKGPVGLSKKNT